MKIILTFFFLFFTSKILADDISNFQIEGMSVNDSLLDYFTKEDINNAHHNYYDWINPKKFYDITLFKESSNFEIYDGVQIALMLNDDNFIIYALDGAMVLKNNEDCDKKIQSISNDIVSLFSLANKVAQIKESHPEDSSGKSITWGNAFFLNNGEGDISVRCYIWSDTMPYVDNYRVSVRTTVYGDWLK
tara:strand:- start:556 stop:1125 length:570 start_codon:yes stop_codon:yes gene_type:complete